MKPIIPAHECRTCGFRKWVDAQEVCAHPGLSRTPTTCLPVSTAFALCQGKFWAEREDEE